MSTAARRTHRSSKPAAIALAFAVALGLAPPASADPHPMTVGGGVAPRGPVAVAVTREELTIDAGLDHADVRAVLDLENRGPARDLLVGFPCARGERAGVVELDCATPIRVAVDGRPVVLRRVAVGQGGEWTWPMQLAQGAKPRVEVRYRARLANDRYSHGAFGMLALHYRLTTGADWLGPIGQLTMTVRVPSDAIALVGPAGHVRTPHQIRWTLKDYEPAADVAVVFVPRSLERLARLEAQLRARDLPTRETARLAILDLTRQLPGCASEMREVLAVTLHGPEGAELAEQLNRLDFAAELAASATLIEATAAPPAATDRDPLVSRGEPNPDFAYRLEPHKCYRFLVTAGPGIAVEAVELRQPGREAPVAQRAGAGWLPHCTSADAAATFGLFARTRGSGRVSAVAVPGK